MKSRYLLCLFLLIYNFINSFSQTPTKAEMVTLNGSNIYYEEYGKGEPLFLLHGFTQSSQSWLPYVDDYANDFKVYLVDLRGHGRSSQFKEKLSIKAAAMDLNALINHLKIQQINAIGFSYGGDVLFQLALLNPSLIKSMISIGASGSWNANDFPHWVEYLSYKNVDNLPWMRVQQTSDEQIRSILDQMVNYRVYLGDNEMKGIHSNILFVFGDQDDSIPLEEISRARKNLPNTSLWILPNTSHSAHKDKNKSEFVRVSKDFFKGQWTNK